MNLGKWTPKRWTPTDGMDLSPDCFDAGVAVVILLKSLCRHAIDVIIPDDRSDALGAIDGLDNAVLDFAGDRFHERVPLGKCSSI